MPNSTANQTSQCIQSIPTAAWNAPPARTFTASSCEKLPPSPTGRSARAPGRLVADVPKRHREPVPSPEPSRLLDSSPTRLTFLGKLIVRLGRRLAELLEARQLWRSPHPDRSLVRPRDALSRARVTHRGCVGPFGRHPSAGYVIWQAAHAMCWDARDESQNRFDAPRD